MCELFSVSIFMGFRVWILKFCLKLWCEYLLFSSVFSGFRCTLWYPLSMGWRITRWTGRFLSTPRVHGVRLVCFTDLLATRCNRLVSDRLCVLLFRHHMVTSRRSVNRIIKRLGIRTRQNQHPIVIIHRAIQHLHACVYSDVGYRMIWRI